MIDTTGMSDNLMIDGSIYDSGGTIAKKETTPETRYTDFEAFEVAVAAAARHYQNAAKAIGLNVLL